MLAAQPTNLSTRAAVANVATSLMTRRCFDSRCRLNSDVEQRRVQHVEAERIMIPALWFLHYLRSRPALGENIDEADRLDRLWHSIRGGVE
jgi:hypothetical protein